MGDALPSWRDETTASHRASLLTTWAMHCHRGETKQRRRTERRYSPHGRCIAIVERRNNGVAPSVATHQMGDALPSWRDETTASHRASLLTKWGALMAENADDLATIMTLESGKPLAESHGEVNYAKAFLDYYAAEAIRPTGAGGGFMVPCPFPGSNGGPKGHVMAMQQAVGVAAMVTPWNFPLAMLTRKV